MDFEAFTTPADEAVTLSISSGSIQHTFTPEMTDYVFQHDNLIIGYKDPKIDISFRGNDMRASAKISYRQKMKPDRPELEKLMDIEGQLKEFLPESAFEERASDDMDGVEGWTPPGERVQSYSNASKQYEIWTASLADRRAIAILKNMKILIPMFIEGGTVGFLDDDEVPQHKWTIERWKLFLVYEVDEGSYSLAAFCTSYRLSVLASEDITKTLPAGASVGSEEPSELDQFVDSTEHPNGNGTSTTKSATTRSLSQYPSRERISQFIILPPYQHSCHGIKLYDAVTDRFLADPFVFEITVEDPNENFDNLRDYCDLARLYADPEFASLGLPESIPAEKLRSGQPVPLNYLLKPGIINSLCQRHKLIKRQVQRLVEVHLLKSIPMSSRSSARIMRKGTALNVDDRKYYFFRLLLKQRIFVRNYDELQQVEESERVPKIESATDACVEQYQSLLEGFENRIEKGFLKAQLDGPTEGGAEVTKSRAMGKKRKVIDDDSDESEAAAVSSKRQATEELLGDR